MGMYGKCKQGFYKLINPAKYDGNVDQVVFRSGLEYRYFRYLDLNNDILMWGSETVVVPYVSLDGRYHRYFVDLYTKVKNKNNEIKEFICEIKPYDFTIPPKEQKRKTKQWKEKYKNYLINQAKWDAATQFAEKNGWKFIVLTERDIK